MDKLFSILRNTANMDIDAEVIKQLTPAELYDKLTVYSKKLKVISNELRRENGIVLDTPTDLIAFTLVGKSVLFDGETCDSEFRLLSNSGVMLSIHKIILVLKLSKMRNSVEYLNGANEDISMELTKINRVLNTYLTEQLERMDIMKVLVINLIRISHSSMYKNLVFITGYNADYESVIFNTALYSRLLMFNDEAINDICDVIKGINKKNASNILRVLLCDIIGNSDILDYIVDELIDKYSI